MSDTVPDFDIFETSDEAVFFRHHEHFGCDCDVCTRYVKSLDEKVDTVGEQNTGVDCRAD